METLYQSLVAVEPLTLIATICNLFVQMFIIKKFFLDKILAVLDQRRQAADKQISEAQTARQEAMDIKKNYEQNMLQATQQANEILANAQKTATERSEKIIGEAQQQAAQIKSKASADIAMEKKKAINDAKNEISGLAMAIASKDPLPIRAIAAVIQHNTSGFATAVSKNITSPADFEGKTYSSWGGPGEAATLHAVMDSMGADFSKLNIVISDGSGFAALEKNVDVMWFYEAWDNVKCQLNNFPINYMELRQYDERLDYYTPVIITSNRMIEENPETVYLPRLS